jgi:2-oxoglutarate ferredoxin oxidoreductase subunit alpha
MGRANALHFGALYPFPLEATRTALTHAKQIVFVEGNATGQFETLFRTRTGLTGNGAIRKYDGRPFSPEYIIRQSVTYLPEEA